MARDGVGAWPRARRAGTLARPGSASNAEESERTEWAIADGSPRSLPDVPGASSADGVRAAIAAPAAGVGGDRTSADDPVPTRVDPLG